MKQIRYSTSATLIALMVLLSVAAAGHTTESRSAIPGNAVWIDTGFNSMFEDAAVTGHLWAVWGDPRPGSAQQQQPHLEVYFTDQWDEQHRVNGSPSAISRFAESLGGSWVEASLNGSWRTDELGHSRFVIDGFDRASEAKRGSAMLGSLPWVTILCRFGDDTGTTPETPGWFTSMMSNAVPGQDHFWRQNSYDQMDLIGSQVVGWFNLPQPKAYYFHGSTNGTVTVQGAHNMGMTSVTLATGAGSDFSLVAGDQLFFGGVVPVYEVQAAAAAGASSSAVVQISPALDPALVGGETAALNQTWNGFLFHGRAAQDCAGVADASVDFSGFQGVNFIYNDDLDGAAWGGFTCFNVDSTTVCRSATWMPPWGYRSHNVMAQEMGHGYGLPHSSGPYSGTYDSQWDTMSGGGTCAANHIEYGCLGVNTVMHHKNDLGWIAADRKLTVNDGEAQTVTIERSALPVLEASDKLMVIVPIGASATNFYTVEYRQIAGDYEVNLPGQGILIHKVDTTLNDRDAQVVDEDGNGNTNDAGAVWNTGETFTDGANQITIEVLSESGSSASVRVTSGTSTTIFSDGFESGDMLEWSSQNP